MNYRREDEEDLLAGRGKRAGEERLNFKAGHTAHKSSQKPSQAIVKVAGWATTSGSVRSMMLYIGRADGRAKDKDDLEIEDEVGTISRGAAEIDQLHAAWKDDFKRRKSGATRQPRHAVHLILSAKGDKDNPKDREAVKEAARQTVQKHFQGNYSYVLGVHQDGKYPHVHLVVNTTPQDKALGKLRIGPKELMAMKKTFAKELTQRGLKHVATRPKRKKTKPLPAKWKNKAVPTVLQRVDQVLDKLQKEERSFQRRMNRTQPVVDVLRHRSAQQKAIETLEKRVGLVTVESSDKLSERMEARKKVAAFKAKLTKNAKTMDPTKAFEATTAYLLKEADALEKDYLKARKDHRFGSVGNEKSDAMPELDTRNNKFQFRTDQFYKELKRADMAPEKKKGLYGQLRPKIMELKKFRGREMERGK